MRSVLMILLATGLLATGLLATVTAAVAAEQDGAAESPGEDAQPAAKADPAAAAEQDVAAESPGEDAQPAAKADPAAEGVPENYSCMFCHGEDGMLADEEDTKHLVVTEEHLADDIHWQKGLRCHDCHGGNPNLDDYTDHRDDAGFRFVESPKDIPGFCGRCHSDIEYMRRYGPSYRTDQEAEYWTSGHGQHLKATDDPKVATCISCHGGNHSIFAVHDLKSPVYPTRVAETCSNCHSDEQMMAGRTYQGRDIGTDQYQQWRNSVHGKAMLEGGDLSSPTCNDCHGNHGALPPEIGSVANACGTCHGKVAELFAETSMKHRFEEAGLPGCATCHGDHGALSPTDEMLGMESGSVCKECHEKNEYGATIVGADAARNMRDGLEQLKNQIALAENKIAEADFLGMEVRGPRFDLQQARHSLTSARSLMHTFATGPVDKALAEGQKVTSEVIERAEAALKEHAYRRVWLAASLVPILIVVILLVAFIRSMPSPAGRQ